ncbi:hypothetical protein KUTeg_022303, partial [Tegillarca granosa]
GDCVIRSRYPKGFRFIPFPKPRRNKDKCLRWIKLCGRPNDQLRVYIVDGNRHLFGELKDRYPYSMPAIPNSQVPGTQTPARKPPNKIALSEPPKKNLQKPCGCSEEKVHTSHEHMPQKESYHEV